jgi:hypothetical protein
MRLPRLFDDAAAAGYRILSLSGGEPFLYPDLAAVVSAAKKAGLMVNLVSNGTLIDDRHAAWVAGNIDLIAISIDGPPDLHNEIRGDTRAFRRAVAGIEALHRAGARHALIHTATESSIRDLTWLIDFAIHQRALFLQIHPLERTGRAQTDMSDETSANLPSRLAYLLGVLAGDSCPVPVHLDVLSREHALVMEAGLTKAASQPLSHILDPLVIEQDGFVVPWTYGLDRRFALGSVEQTPLSDLLADYQTTGRLHQALTLRRKTAERIATDQPWPFVDWFSAMRGGIGEREAAV